MATPPPTPGDPKSRLTQHAPDVPPNDDRADTGRDTGLEGGADAASHTLGSTSGGERASAGQADENRSSRDHGNSLQEHDPGGL
ncbi:hypothetical protein LY625_10485 [Lysobacter sp. GX 14042]|uniref:hypothetical protein n=1 Tax=Lysobacter sp. GX 14042 TaxID=2907155 RepID=UPI001F1F26DF|nr:hypothetical protein [Lysobacter sp. GX 14042]MCE7033034.1 hypothetical protein [Lysobacter sp. GX 14042]